MGSIGKKIKGFTLLEVVITILLSLLLFSILYFSHTIIQKNVKRSSTDLSEVLLLKQIMEKCFDESDWIMSKDGYLELHHVSGKSVLELPGDFILLERSHRTDTLFKGKYNYRISIDPKTQFVDELLFELQPDEPADTILLGLSKNYLPAMVLRRKEVDFEY